MGNCQAIDNATLVIQHPNGKVDKMYSPVSANQVMKMNPGHYVALLLTTTTTYSPPTTATATAVKNNYTPLRVTRIKLLRSTDTLVLGHVYRLITTQEVMKGLRARKRGQMKQKQMQQQQSEYAEKYRKMMRDEQISDFEAVIKKTEMEKTKQVKHRPRNNNNNNNNTGNSGVSKSRAWQPSLKSISEAGS